MHAKIKNLNKIKKEYDLPIELFDKIRKSLYEGSKNDLKLLEDLPFKM